MKVFSTDHLTKGEGWLLSGEGLKGLPVYKRNTVQHFHPLHPDNQQHGHIVALWKYKHHTDERFLKGIEADRDREEVDILNHNDNLETQSLVEPTIK